VRNTPEHIAAWPSAWRGSTARIAALSRFAAARIPDSAQSYRTRPRRGDGLHLKWRHVASSKF
jgi:hypothetical protein